MKRSLLFRKTIMNITTTHKADETLDYITSHVAVGPRLADQLLLPLTFAGSGRFTIPVPMPYFFTNTAMIWRFLPIQVQTEKRGSNLMDRVSLDYDRYSTGIPRSYGSLRLNEAIR